ncbi:MAG: hypothetical protein WAM60_23565 [Candidatus Promineifilaceae bacterium]
MVKFTQILFLLDAVIWLVFGIFNLLRLADWSPGQVVWAFVFANGRNLSANGRS